MRADTSFLPFLNARIPQRSCGASGSHASPRRSRRARLAPSRICDACKESRTESSSLPSASNIRPQARVALARMESMHAAYRTAAAALDDAIARARAAGGAGAGSSSSGGVTTERRERSDRR